MQGNLKIAEDRLLSYLLLLQEAVARETHWVPTALFYFESEDRLNEFIPQRRYGYQQRSCCVCVQHLCMRGHCKARRLSALFVRTHHCPPTLRINGSAVCGAFNTRMCFTRAAATATCRRWLNGTVSGYLWLIFSAKLYAVACRARFRPMAWKVFFVSLLQLCVFAGVFIMPALTGLTGHMALEGAAMLCGVWGFPASYSTTAIAIAVYWILYFGSFCLLMVHARWLPNLGLKNGTGVWNRLWNFRIGMNACIMVTNMVVLAAFVFTSGRNDALDAVLPVQNQLEVHFVFAMAIFYTLSPFYLGLMHSWDSFKCMVSAFPSYFLFGPTILGDFFSFSLCNFDNWKWGTKEVAVVAPAAGTALVVEGATINGFSAEEQAKSTLRARNRHSASTTTLFLTQVVANGTLILLSLLLKSRIRIYFLVIGGVMFAIGLFLMLSSFVYFLQRAHAKHGASMRALLSVVVMVSWVGGLTLLLIFAPTPYTTTSIAFVDENSYVMSFTCIFFLVVFVVVRGLAHAAKLRRRREAAIALAVKALRRSVSVCHPGLLREPNAAGVMPPPPQEPIPHHLRALGGYLADFFHTRSNSLSPYRSAAVATVACSTMLASPVIVFVMVLMAAVTGLSRRGWACGRGCAKRMCAALCARCCCLCCCACCRSRKDDRARLIV